MPATTTEQRAALRAVAVLARAHSQALSHYEAGADEDAAFWREAELLLTRTGLELERFRRRVQSLIDERHIPGKASSRCGRCATLIEERRELTASLY